MRAIGFAGHAGAGKDTAADFLAEHLRAQGLTVRRGAWADKLKVSAARSLGFDGTEAECVEFCDRLKVSGTVHTMVGRVDDALGRSIQLTGREFLEKLGTEGGRDVHGPNVWVDLALPAPDRFPGYAAPTPEGWDDVDWYIDSTTRFLNEVQRIREWDGHVLEVVRPEEDLRAATTGHASRVGLPAVAVDAVVGNEGTLDQLRMNVCDAFDILEGAAVGNNQVRIHY